MKSATSSIRYVWLGICVFLSASQLACQEELLKNADFAELADNGIPLHWQVYETVQKLSADRADKPEGSRHSLRVDIQAARAGSYGQIVQSLKTLQPDTAYMLTGYVKSTRAGLAFLEVKLLKERKELQRVDSPRSTTGWQMVTRSFFTGDADEVQVLCRYVQAADAVGQTAWFAQLTLTPAGPPSLNIESAVTTFHSLGLRITYGGSVSPDSVCRVRYRPVGQAEWWQALDLIPDRADTEFRGSLLCLTPGTEYEVECQLVEPTAPNVVRCSARTTARTWKEEVPIGEVRTLPAGVSNEPLVINAQGKPDGWIVYRPPEGQTSTVDAEWKAEQAIRIENAAYVIFENIIVRGGARHAINVVNSHHVWVRRCDIAGWGDPGIRKEGLESGLYVDKNGRVINYHVGVHVCQGSSQVVVEDNFIHDPRGTANSWQYGHPAGPQGVLLNQTGGNNVVRYNDIIGSEQHWWNDAIESIRNGDITGGPYRDTDIYGNVLAFSNDDGTELDGGQINVRYWHNWIDKALCGISCAPNLKGPSYVFRNLIACLGEERDAAGSAFKMGGGARWSPGMNIILHNTNYGKGGGLRSVGYGSEEDRGGYVAFSRNNLFAGPGRGDVTNISKDPRNDYDYDLIGRGGVSLMPGQEQHAIVEPPRLMNAAAGDYRLADGSPGIDQGCRLPGLNDDFAGAGPDMGAFERGKDDQPVFPPRPSGMSALPMRLAVDDWPGNRLASGKVLLEVPPSAGTRWTAYPNSAWLACAPSSGPASPTPQTVVVTVANPELEIRLHRGAITFRTDAGFNRTVMVDIKVYPPRPLALAFEAEAGQVRGGLQKAEDPAASGRAYLHTPDGAQPGTVEFTFDIPEDGVYYIAARCMVPEPDPGLHDSFMCSMDGQPSRIWDLDRAGAGVNRWTWVLVNARDEEIPCRFRLSKGPHKLIIGSREALARLDRVVITNSPYAEDPREVPAR